MLYGTHGIGKSTFASCAPKPIFLQTEDGLGEIDCDKFPLTTTFDQAMTGPVGALHRTALLPNGRGRFPRLAGAPDLG